MFLVVVLTNEKQILVLDSLAASSIKPSAVETGEQIWSLLGELDNSLDEKQWSFSTNIPEEIPNSQTVLTVVFSCPGPITESKCFQSLRCHMLIELHQQELQSLTDHVIQQNSYYAVGYGKSYYIGRALEEVGDDNFRFKFLLSVVRSGAKVFDWPGHDDLYTVHKFVWFVALLFLGSLPFSIPTIASGGTSP